MEANPGVYMPFTEENEDFDMHCARMRRPRQWGGMVQLQAIAETYRRIIRVYRSNEPQHRQLYTDYLPQRSSPINLTPMEILYDLHGSHYWYIQGDLMPRAKRMYDRHLLLEAIDKWQTLWVRMIDQTAGTSVMIRSHRTAVAHWNERVMSAALVEWKFTRRLAPFMQRRRARKGIQADLHFQGRVVRRAFMHIRRFTSQLRDHVVDAINKVVRMKDGPMPLYLELAS